MAAGLPILANDTPDVHDVLESGVQGYLFETSDSSSLLDAVSRLSESPGLGIQVGLAARRRASEAFSLTRAVDQHEQLFHRMASKGSSKQS